jgi:hypothetical protein
MFHRKQDERHSPTWSAGSRRVVCIQLFSMPYVPYRMVERFFTGAAGDGHVVFILTLQLVSFLSFSLLPNVRCLIAFLFLFFPFFFQVLVGSRELSKREECRLLDTVSVISTSRPRPWWSRPCGLGHGGLDLCGLGLRGGLGLCGLDPRGFVSASAVSTSASVSYSALLALLCFLVFSFLLHVNQHLCFQQRS